MNTYKEKLLLGYRKFTSGKAKLQRGLYQDLIINGQKPKIMVIFLYMLGERVILKIFYRFLKMQIC